MLRATSMLRVRTSTAVLLAAAALALTVFVGCRPATRSAALEPCRLQGIEREVFCGRVARAEDPDAPGGRSIDIRFAVVPAVARNKLPDPVFVLAGGPGQAGTRIARQLMPVLAELNARRDLVFIDQRGTGGSNALECRFDERSLEAALASLVALCADDVRCRTRYPALEERISALLARAGQEVRVSHPLTGQVETLRLERPVVASLLRVPLYAPQLGALLPHALAEASRGDYTALVALSAALSSGLSENFAAGMHFAVICAEDLPRIGDAARAQATPTRFGTAFIDQYEKACRAVPTRPVPSGFYEIASSSVPVLILSGGLDPATPPRHGDYVAQRLGNASHLVAPNLGHGISAQACAPTLITRFVRDASFERIDGDCLARVPAPPFFAPIVLPSGKPS
jgi:pimeloyl-ACP methyl ester carboxylesterase